jgi:CRISPR-associated exonuclease Cas4
MDYPDYLPISMLNQFEYCPRRFWYMFVLGEMVINEHVLEGILRHEHAHAPGRQTEDGEVVLRRVSVHSDQLRLNGYVDVVEEADGQLCPVEYKKGRMGRWLNDHVQLCAQALCLEEQTDRRVTYGYIFYFGSRRRDRVDFTPELRARTEASLRAVFELLERGQMPAPIDQVAKCRDCSLEPVCLPQEVKLLCQPST